MFISRVENSNPNFGAKFYHFPHAFNNPEIAKGFEKATKDKDGDDSGDLEQAGNTVLSSGEGTTKLQGYTVMGTIEILKIDVKYPILENVTKKSIELAVAVLYGPGLNQVGNTTIAGHNYRNGLFFSNNKKLSVGDKIYITDSTGKRLSYTIYDKYEAEENYSDYITRDTQGAIEISLTTCTDDSQARIIILAKADV